jgi:hypothetical protein
MRFEDKDDGEYRIHAGALELRAGEGFLAAVIVNRSSQGRGDGHEVYRDTEVSGGHRWLTSDQALQHALLVGANAVTAERHRTPSQVAVAAVLIADRARCALTSQQPQQAQARHAQTAPWAATLPA